jgi:hypothetical protein
MTDINQDTAVARPIPTEPGDRARTTATTAISAASKTDVVLKKLRSAKGVSIDQLTEATGWQPHSVRGFLSATVRKKLGLNLVSAIGKDEIRRYRVIREPASPKS